jgi:hypothetical protein
MLSEFNVGNLYKGYCKSVLRQLNSAIANQDFGMVKSLKAANFYKFLLFVCGNVRDNKK